MVQFAKISSKNTNACQMRMFTLTRKTQTNFTELFSSRKFLFSNVLLVVKKSFQLPIGGQSICNKKFSTLLGEYANSKPYQKLRKSTFDQTKSVEKGTGFSKFQVMRTGVGKKRFQRLLSGRKRQLR